MANDGTRTATGGSTARLRLLALLALMTTALLASSPEARSAALVPLAPASSWGSSPLNVASPPYDYRVFVAERSGAIRVFKNGALLDAPYLEVPGVATDGERGLSSIAFAPDFDTSGRLYVFTTDGSAIKVLEYRVPDPAADTAGAAGVRTVLSVADNSPYHNGGQLAFGPDGYLYVTIGDDRDSSTAQNLASLDGKILRIDPRAGTPYAVPAGNPFAATPGALPEIWASGFRNPFRASFAPDGRLVVGDVGESAWEEVDLVGRGGNYGWPACEGDSGTGCGSPPFTAPLHAYPHSSSSAAVIGGYVVRDPRLGALTGRYLFGDLIDPELRTLSLDTPGGDSRPAGLSLSGLLNSFGEDAAGCVYVIADNTVYRVASSSSGAAACGLPLPARPPTAASIAIRSRRLKARRMSSVRVKLACTSQLACSGRLSIKSRARIRIRGHKRIVTFANARYKLIRGGRTRTVTLRISATGRAALLRKRSIPVVVRATAARPSGRAQVAKVRTSLRR